MYSFFDCSRISSNILKLFQKRYFTHSQGSHLGSCLMSAGVLPICVSYLRLECGGRAGWTNKKPGLEGSMVIPDTFLLTMRDAISATVRTVAYVCGSSTGTCTRSISVTRVRTSEVNRPSTVTIVLSIHLPLTYYYVAPFQLPLKKRQQEQIVGGLPERLYITILEGRLDYRNFNEICHRWKLRR
jgi:hypothetical protein